MTTNHRTPGRLTTPARRAATAAVALPVIVLLTAPAMGSAAVAGLPMAASDGVSVINTETVQARLDATGAVREARLYEQLSFTGTGTATVVNPTSTAGLRNLDGFGGFTSGDGSMEATVDVQGEARLRTVSDFDGEMPIGVEVEYELDGETVGPGAVVGRDGTLEVRYTVTNMTTREDEVTYDDGTGTMVTATAETVIPMVGQLTTTLPPSFTDVASEQASIAGDGRGGTKLSFTMTLFPPIGSPTASFGYTAQIRGGVIPPANVSALPVSPLTSPSFAGGSASYAGGAASGVALTAGAMEIDANLLRLRDGAATLLDGLQQLQVGAAALSAGLNGSAAPGAAELASGAAQLDDGARQVGAGAFRLDGGAKQLSAGAAKADDGAQQLAQGAGQLHGGAQQVAGGASQTAAGAKQVAAGAGALDAGLTEAGGKAPALLGGLAKVQAGLADVDAGLAEMYDSIGTLPTEAQALVDGLAKMKNGVTQLQAGASTLRTTATGLGTLLTALADTDPIVVVAGNALVLGQLGEFVAQVAEPKLPGPEKDALNAIALRYTTPGGVDVNLSDGLTVLGGALTNGVVPGLWALQCGLGGLDAGTTTAVCGGKTGLAEGLADADAGLAYLVTTVVGNVQGGVGTAGQTAEDETLRGGLGSLQTGTEEIMLGAQTLLAGLGELSAGAASLSVGASSLSTGTASLDAGAAALSAGTANLHAGAGELAAGTSQLDSGAATLSTGAGELVAGAGRLTAGSSRLADGSADLASGLRDAADGSVELSDGLTTAADGAPALVEGAEQLSVEGTAVLVETGAATAADYGIKYAVIEAGTERAATEAMAYGAPAGAGASTAYSLDIAGADGSGASAFGRGVVAAALFALGSIAAGVLRRRFV